MVEKQVVKMISQPCLFTDTLEDKARKHYKMEESKENMSTITVMAALEEKSQEHPLNMTNNIQRASHPIPYWHLSCANNNNDLHPILEMLSRQ